MVTFVYHSIHVFNALMPRISAPYFSSFDRQSANIGHMNKAHCQKKKIKILIFLLIYMRRCVLDFRCKYNICIFCVKKWLIYEVSDSYISIT